MTAPDITQAGFQDLVCDDHARLKAQIQRQHNTQKQARALRGPDALIEVWVDSRTGDWTLVQSYSNGTACIVAIGEHWEMLRPEIDPA